MFGWSRAETKRQAQVEQIGSWKKLLGPSPLFICFNKTILTGTGSLGCHLQWQHLKWAQVHLLAASLLIHLPYNMPERTAEDDTSVWALSPIFPCFPRHIDKELHQRWGNQVSNMGCQQHMWQLNLSIHNTSPSKYFLNKKAIFMV